MMWICRRWTEYKRRTSGWMHVFYQAKTLVRMRTSTFAKRRCDVTIDHYLLAV